MTECRSQQTLTGLVGMIAALLLETWLYIIRTNFEPHPALKKRPVPPKQAGQPGSAASSSSAGASASGPGAEQAVPRQTESKKTQ